MLTALVIERKNRGIRPQVWARLNWMESTMRQVLSLVAAAALLASGGVANAKGPLTLTDSQLDKVTAGAAATADVTNLPLAFFTSWAFGGVLGPNGPLGPHGVLPGATH
jgi:hypothetical protein